MIARKSWLWIAAGGVLIAALAWILHRIEHADDEQRVLTASVPPRPDLGSFPTEFSNRIANCEQRIHAGRGAVEALGELSRLYHANGFFAEASQGYSGLIQLAPQNPLWPHLFATVLAGFGQLDAALPLWHRTVELAPDYLPPLIRLGDILQKRNETAAAAEIYSSILHRSPHDPFALVGLAQLDIAAGRWTEACARLELAATSTARVPARDLLAKVYERLGDTARADAEKSRAGAGESDLWDVPDPWVAGLMDECYDATQLVVASTIATDLTTTRRYLDRAVSVDPNNAYARRQLGQLLFKQKEYAGARTHLERAVALAPAESDNWIYLITLLNKVGDDTAVQRALDAGLAQCPNSPSLHLELGRRLKSAGRLPDALAELAIARRLRPQEADAYVESADVYFRLNQLDLAAAQLRDALAAVPDHPVALLLLAHSAIDNANEPEATRLIQRARQQLKIPPGDRSALVRDFQQRFGKTPP